MPTIQPEEETTESLTLSLKSASLEGSSFDESSPNGEQEFVCSICTKPYLTPPRILSCLHVFCEHCLNESLKGVSESLDGVKNINCPLCSQVTNVNNKGGASTLPCDYILMNIFEMGAINNSSLICTSCKAKDMAVARCADCPSFLCPQCTGAHKVMTVFENHYVVSLEELKKSSEKIPFHRPITCGHHKKLIQFYCSTCQEPICVDCTKNEHKAPLHSFNKLRTAILEEREKLESLITDAQNRKEECQKSNTMLENSLLELQTQHDNAKELIDETFQHYKMLLEKVRNEALDDLGTLHSKQELKVMEALQTIGKKADKIEYACSFASRVLDNGSESEVLMLKRVISSQLEGLVSSLRVKPNYSTSLVFITNADNFKRSIKKLFGYVKDPDVVSPPEKSAILNGHDTIEPITNGFIPTNGMDISMMNGCATTKTVSMQSSPIASSPLSLPSSFESDLNFPTVTSPPTPPLDGLSSMAEVNLSRLASLINKPASPPMSTSDSTFSLDLLSTEMSAATIMNNIQALANLENAASIITNGCYAGGINGIDPTSMLSSQTFDTTDTSSVLDGSISGNSGITLMNGMGINGMNTMNGINGMNGHGSMYDAGSASYYSRNDIAYPGMDTNMMHHMAMNHHHNSFPGSSYGRGNCQRACPLEIKFKFGQLGSNTNQFGLPHGFCIDREDCIVVADTNNHRIQVFNKDGEFRMQFGIGGKLDGQLWYPRKIEILPNGDYVICDRGTERSRLQVFSREGMYLNKIRLKYVEIVAGMTVTEDGSVVIVDSVSPSVYKVDETGTTSTWFNCKGIMSEPSDIAVNNNRFYICDFKGHCVAVFSSDGYLMHKIGGQGLTDFPNGIDILPNGHILVGDSHGNKFHICIFDMAGNLLYEYECPYVKVSRCCGLKVSSEGNIVTVAKNNHHVLVFKNPM